MRGELQRIGIEREGTRADELEFALQRVENMGILEEKINSLRTLAEQGRTTTLMNRSIQEEMENIINQYG